MQLQLESTDLFADIDPRLQRLLERKSRGMTTVATASTQEGEVAVIAKVNNLQEWLSINEVYPGADLGSTSIGERIVTARVPVSRLTQIKQSPCVVSLKAAQPLKPTLKVTLEEIAARKDPLPQNSTGEQGRGVVIGIIDSGCDFALVKRSPSLPSDASDPVLHQIEAQVNSLLNSDLSSEEKIRRAWEITVEIRSGR